MLNTYVLISGVIFQNIKRLVNTVENKKTLKNENENYLKYLKIYVQKYVRLPET